MIIYFLGMVARLLVGIFLLIASFYYLDGMGLVILGVGLLLIGQAAQQARMEELLSASRSEKSS